jgi:hypothetical protein
MLVGALVIAAGGIPLIAIARRPPGAEPISVAVGTAADS